MFDFYSQQFKNIPEVNENKENRREWFDWAVVLRILADRFICFAESDARPRFFRSPDRRPGEKVRRGHLVDITNIPSVAQRAGGMQDYLVCVCVCVCACVCVCVVI